MSAALFMNGFVLGWSVAWPPGPVNAEMIRRSLSGGFRSAIAVGLGACLGDFLWALGTASGASAVVELPGVKTALGILSLGLLVVLGGSFLRGAWRSRQAARGGATIPAGGRLDGTRGGLVLGMSLALSSPWNIAFWLAVIGGQSADQLGLVASVSLAAAVVAGAASWCVVFCTALRLGARFATPAWEITTRALTGVLMLGFAVRLAWRLAHEL